MIPNPRLLFPFLLLLLAAPPSSAALYKCVEDGATAYTDQPCADARTPPLNAPSLPTMPPMRPAAAPSPDKPATRKTASTGENRQARALAAQRKKCAGLALRRRWAAQEVREAGARPLRPQDKALRNAERKAQRADEQYRLECAEPS